MIFFKLCCILIWPVVFSWPQVKNPSRANTPFPKTINTPLSNPTSTQCKSSVESNGRTMAYCYNSWPLNMPEDYDEVRIIKAMKNEISADLVRTIRVKQILRIKDCDVGSIQAKTFATFTSLTTLDLSKNLITRIDAEVFSGLWRLQELNLSENKITYIAPNAFIMLSKLNTLELQNNELNRMPTELPKTLQDLNLANNKMELAEKILQLPNLIKLNLCKTRLDKYPQEFLHCPKLETLCIEEITLKSTTSFPFRNVSGLKILNINGDNSYSEPIPSLRTGFEYLTHLEQLTIRQCSLDDLSFLIPLRELRALTLTSVQVQTHLQEYQFASCGNLQQLDLSNSEGIAREITRNKVLVHFQSLKKLVLSECQLKSLDWFPKPTPDVTPSQPEILPQLEILDVSNNPLQCKDPETQHALCYLSRLTYNFSPDIDPRIVNKATTASSTRHYGRTDDYYTEHDSGEEVQPSKRPPYVDHITELQIMKPQETVCSDMQDQSVDAIGEKFCHNLPELTTRKPTSSGSAGSTDELRSRESSGLSTETIWYIVLGVILGLLLLTVIVLCIVCTKKNRGHHDIDGEPPAPTFQALKQQASSQDALLDGTKK